MPRLGALAAMSLVASLAGAGCDSVARPAAATLAAPGTSAPPSPSAVAPASAVDAAFRGYRKKLPEPANLSEGNGVSTVCASGAHATYTLLDATADKVPIAGDRDLPALVPWARDDDPCIRQIALKAILKHVPFDANRLAVPSMHHPEHYLYRDILGALATYLDDHHVASDPKIFDGLMLTVRDADFDRVMVGRWEEEVSPGQNFQTFVEIESGTMRTTNRLRRPDPKWPETTYTLKIGGVHVDAGRRFVVTASSRVETNSKGYRGAEQVPTAPYAFWPVHDDVAWFDEGRANTWVKLRRASR